MAYNYRQAFEPKPLPTKVRHAIFCAAAMKYVSRNPEASGKVLILINEDNRTVSVEQETYTFGELGF